MKTADLCDDFASKLKVCTMEFQSYGKHKRFSGPIATVKVFEDNVLVKEALQKVPSGTVLVVDGGGSRRCALMGDRLGAIAEERQLAGVIIHGCIRDAADIAEQAIGVMAIGTNPMKSVKAGKGQTNIPLQFGDIDWIPGHYVYADEDGIVVAEQPVHIEKAE